ncbi:alpha/beta fold hydrolase [Halovivax gelatinilyticus]|uniref:alpha/beta fold hydrolase n=1 Tax=Halovivax gelatinilyticus TaxID=2961597 RepID=UPI0020CA6FA5|nr:alpha/beta fold hydrolase [Halovivax gelatinilyticus]
MSVYRSAAGRRVLEACYEDALARLDVDVTERFVDTWAGETHVLCAGPTDGQPVIVFHGGNATNPMTLSWYADLADEYRLIAPDTIGQPGYSAETRPDPRGEGYGAWVVDLLDAFELASAPMIGTSYGAGIVLRTAARAPDRIDRAGLVVPAGFGTGSISTMAKIGLCSIAYRYVPSDRLLDRVLASIVTDPDADPVVRETVAASLRHVELEREFPTASADELADFDAPVALSLGEEDPFFPPDVIEPRASDRLESADRVGILPGEKHVLSKRGQKRVADSIRSFLSV